MTIPHHYPNSPKNHPLHRDNKSGFSGVLFRKDTKKWQASITVNGQRKYIGCYHTKAEAVAARKEAERVFGFHENHGSRPSRWIGKDGAHHKAYRRAAAQATLKGKSG